MRSLFFVQGWGAARSAVVDGRTGVLHGDGEKMRTAGAVLIFEIELFLEYQQQAQGYEELFIGFFPEEQEQQQ